MTNEVTPDKQKRRRMAGIASMVVGITNFLSAILLCFSGVVLAIILIVVAVAMITEESGADPLKDACALFILIAILLFLVVCLIATLIAFMFALAVGGQTLGGWYAFKGKRFKRAAAFIFIGSAAAFMMGSAMLVTAILGKEIHFVPRAIIGVLAMYEFISFLISMVSGIVIVGAKETFDSDPTKKKGRSPDG